MVLFEKILKSKFDPDINQNAPNCTISKNFLGGACPQTLLAKCMFATCKFPNLKNYSWPPSKILGTPLLSVPVWSLS